MFLANTLGFGDPWQVDLIRLRRVAIHAQHLTVVHRIISPDAIRYSMVIAVFAWIEFCGASLAMSLTPIKGG